MSGRQWGEIAHGRMARVLYGELGKATRRQQQSVKILTRLVGCYEESESGSNSIEDPYLDQQRPILRLRLFDLNMLADGSLQAMVEARTDQTAQRTKTGFYTAHVGADNQHLEYHYYQNSSTASSSITRFSLGVEGSDSRVVEFGVFLDSTMETSEPVPLIEMTRLVIKSIEAVDSDDVFFIKDVRIIERGQHPLVEKRLAWTWGGNHRHLTKPWVEGMPWSLSTGPFASFSVVFGGEIVGQAYCLEFPLRGEDVENLNEEDDVIVQIIGNIFGGGQAKGPSVSFRRSELLVEGQG